MLEILLASLLVIVSYQLFKAKKRERILRHVFVSHAEWCRHHIANVRASAIANVTTMATRQWRHQGKTAFEQKDALGEVYNDILGANDALSAQQLKAQQSLAKYDIPPLEWSDFDATIFNPKLHRLLND